MNHPTLIALKYAACGVLAFLILVMIGEVIFDSRSTANAANASVAVAVFVIMLFSSTREAYERGKKDAWEERNGRKVSS